MVKLHVQHTKCIDAQGKWEFASPNGDYNFVVSIVFFESGVVEFVYYVLSFQQKTLKNSIETCIEIK